MLPDGAVWCQASWMTRDELLELLSRLSRLRCAPVGRARLRAPHKPLLLLWLFGRFAAVGSTVASYAEAEEPVSALINEFGPDAPVTPGWRREVLGQGLLERLCDHAVASGVRVHIRSERGGRAHPGPLADALDVERNATNEREVSG